MTLGGKHKKTDNEIINSQKFARIREDKQADRQADEHVRQINTQFCSFGSLGSLAVKQTFRQKKDRQTDWQVGNCDIDFYNFRHRKVRNFKISN